MSDLSNEAKARLAALAGEEPGAAEEARVREGLERALGVTLPVATLGAAALASTASAASLSAAGSAGVGSTTGASAAAAGAATGVAAGAGSSVPWLVAALVAVVGGGGVLLARSAAPGDSAAAASKQPPPSAAMRPVVVAPPVSPQEPEAPAAPAPVAEEVMAPASTPQPAPGPSRTASPAPAARQATPPEVPSPVEPAPTEAEALPQEPAPQTVAEEAQHIDPELVCDVDAEGRFADAAEHHLHAGRAARALELLEAFPRRCPSGRWSQRTWAARLGALCALGRDAEATQLRAWHREEYPASTEALLRAAAPWCASLRVP